MARGQQPCAAPWMREVYDAVAALVPGLLERWPTEPPLIRLVLAALAALVPDAGRAVQEQIAEMSRQHAGTDAAALLDLTIALIARDDQGAQQACDALVAGVRDLDTRGLDAPGLPISIRASELLFEATLCIGSL